MVIRNSLPCIRITEIPEELDKTIGALCEKYGLTKAGLARLLLKEFVRLAR